ncbi:NAD kinase [Parapusillimonas granuli]|uniref:NAD kinase n=1 Tax=Parapusillimonas granuli TaxID=380911 RepID=A0A853FWU7_9BURK|nr:NAD kinase [Parapusillimonas granuli]MBB5214976.1 NAD+ kinase [Parapusillimonas granuli]NYT49298.1 NAD kinase [Parapusillimonas granuli]
MHFRTVAIIGRYQDTGLDAPLRKLAKALEAAGCRVLIEADTAQNTGLTEHTVASYTDIGRQADLAVIMGGDGTMLGAARQLAHSDVALIGINHGRLGFITDIPLHSANDALASVIRGNYEAEDRVMLEGRVVRAGQTMFSGIALNDVVLNRAGRGGMIDVRVEFDGAFMYSQRADGLIVATPTGSTAYSLSANGPIVHSKLNAMLLVPVAPQTLSNRPIVLPDCGTLSLTITALGRVESGASVHFDMQTWSDCQPGDLVEVRRAQHTVRFIHPTGYSFFATLRRKLYWNQMPQPSDEAE